LKIRSGKKVEKTTLSADHVFPYKHYKSEPPPRRYFALNRSLKFHYENFPQIMYSKWGVGQDDFPKFESGQKSRPGSIVFDHKHIVK